jgi:outer membrane protein
MKKSFFIPVIALLMIGFAASAQQAKFATIDLQQLLQVMPGRDEARTVLQTHAKTLETQFQKMQTELQTKYQDYIENEATFSDLIKAVKQRELASLQDNIQEFGQQAQTELANKEIEVLSPLVDSARNAIKAVADEHGYAYVFDISSGALLHYPEGDDILAKVKAKLGIE